MVKPVMARVGCGLTIFAQNTHQQVLLQAHTALQIIIRINLVNVRAQTLLLS